MVIKLPNTKVVAFESKQTIGANCSFYVKTIETHARAFLTLNILAIGRVFCPFSIFQYKEARCLTGRFGRHCQ